MNPDTQNAKSLNQTGQIVFTYCLRTCCCQWKLCPGHTNMRKKNMFIMYASILSSLLGQSTSTTSHLMSFLSRHIGKNLQASHSRPLQSSTVMSSQPVKLTGHGAGHHTPSTSMLIFIYIYDITASSNTLRQILWMWKKQTHLFQWVNLSLLPWLLHV